MKRQGCHMLSAEERDRLQEHLFPAGKFNVSLLGKSAEKIAESAGLKVPRGTRVLLVPLERIGDDYPMSREKLCPVLGFFEAATREAALTACRAMVRNRGAGPLGRDPRRAIPASSSASPPRWTCSASRSMSAARPARPGSTRSSRRP